MATKAERQAQRDLAVTLYLMRALYKMLEDRQDFASIRIRELIDTWITDNA